MPGPILIIHERIPLREWLGLMSLFHANVQIRNESARALLITMMLLPDSDNTTDEEALALASVSLHTLKPGYSHLYSIPPHHKGARVTLMTLGEADADTGARLLLRGGDRLRVVEGAASLSAVTYQLDRMRV